VKEMPAKESAKKKVIREKSTKVLSSVNEGFQVEEET
jgi:hypothetical protein